MSERIVKLQGKNVNIKTWDNVNTISSIIIVVHGHGEHVERYEEFAKYFNQKEKLVIGLDLPGFGKSDGLQGYIERFDEYLSIIESLIHETKKNYPDTPIILFGHSMGGLIVLSLNYRWHPEVDLVIANSPWLRLKNELNPILVLSAHFTKFLFPKFRVNTSSRVKKGHFQGIGTDKLRHKKICAEIILGVRRNAKFLLNTISESNVPVLLNHGKLDSLTDPKISKNFASKQNKNVEYKEWYESDHVLHQDNEKHNVIDFMNDWIDKKLSSINKY